MALDVLGTDEFAAWYAALPEPAAEAVTQAVTVLEDVGPAGATKRAVPARFSGQGDALDLYELSIPRTDLRILFAMDGERAVLLYGFDCIAEGPSGPGADFPPAAHMLLAAKVYRHYRKGAA